MRLTCEGEDNLGKFTLFVPDYCEVCDGQVEAGLFYRTQHLKKILRGMGIQPEALLVFNGDKPKHVGITCGCYGKLQRQVAHIFDKKKSRGK